MFATCWHPQTRHSMNPVRGSINFITFRDLNGRSDGTVIGMVLYRDLLTGPRQAARARQTIPWPRLWPSRLGRWAKPIIGVEPSRLSFPVLIRSRCVREIGFETLCNTRRIGRCGDPMKRNPGQTGQPLVCREDFPLLLLSTQTDLAVHLGMDRSFLSDLERGKRRRAWERLKSLRRASM